MLWLFCLADSGDQPRDYKTWVQSKTQYKVQWLPACGHVSASSQSLGFILSLRMNSSFIASRHEKWKFRAQMSWARKKFYNLGARAHSSAGDFVTCCICAKACLEQPYWYIQKCLRSKTLDWACLYFHTYEPWHTCDFQQCGILTSVDSDEPV